MSKHRRNARSVALWLKEQASPRTALTLLACVAAATVGGCGRAGDTTQQPTPATTKTAAHAGTAAAAAPTPIATPPKIDDVPTTVYRDAATGVSFRYPVVWQVSPTYNNAYLPPAIADIPRFQSKVTVVFSPAGNVYEQTNLQDISFSFGVAPVADAAACRNLVATNEERSSPVRTVHGVNGAAFTEIQGGDAAMSHRLQFTMDSAWSAHRCLVFEQDEATIAPGVQPGKRALTASEEAALQRHLHDVFASVTLP